jgi:hypothetical protein
MSLVVWMPPKLRRVSAYTFRDEERRRRTDHACHVQTKTISWYLSTWELNCCQHRRTSVSDQRLCNVALGLTFFLVSMELCDSLYGRTSFSLARIKLCGSLKFLSRFPLWQLEALSESKVK